MAKKFGGFTPQQQQTLLSKMGYTGPAQQDDINKFMMSSPKAASMMGKYAEMAKARVAGGPQTAMQVGGYMANGGYAKRQGYANGGGASGADLTDAIRGAGIDRNAWNTMSDAAKRDAMNNNSRLKNVFSSHDSSSGFDFGGGAVQGTTPNTTGGFDMGIDTPEPVPYPIKQPGDFTGGPALPGPELPVEPEYDPSKGLPTAPELKEVNALDFFKQSTGGVYYLPDYNETALAGLVTEGSDLSGAAAEGNIVTFADGKTITTKSPEEAAQVVKAAGAYTTEVVQPNKTAQDTYNKQLDQYKSYYGQQATVSPEQTRANLDTAQSGLSKEQNLLQSYTTQLANMAADDPQRDTIQGLIDEQQIKVTNARANLSQAQTNLERVGMPSTTEMRADILEDPTSMVTKADVVTVSDEQRAAGKIAEGTGQAAAEADTATLTEAAIADDVPLAEEFEAAGFTAKEAAAEVANVMSKLTAVTGKPSAEALAEAATMDPSQLAQLGLTAEQIDRAQRVEEVTPLEVTPEMRVDSAVDFERARAETNFTAATGVPSSEATVQGQLTGLLEQFEGGETPAWAAGAMRAATATLAARGLGASSMAGQAIVQAAMESALPIAQMDAQTRASFEAQNLSNRQQAAMFAAEQRSKFLGMEFDQEFQSRVQNAARVADVAQINFTAEQQVALENARMAQTVDITNLTAKNAKIMADAAAMSQLDLTNLSNRQQANIQQAKAFLDFDMSSMTNQQQVAMFKAQSLASVFMSDTAAENARRQFNASSSDQVDMFFSNLQTQIQQSNVDQRNAMERFNAGEANAISQFNSAQQNARDQFNANNALVVEQANAQWEQAITTMDNAAQNAANRDAAVVANNLTETTYNNMLQQERDALDYAVRIADREDQQEHALTLEGISNDAAASAASGSAVGTVIATASALLLKKAIGV
jgi:hypothetical protein